MYDLANSPDSYEHREQRRPRTRTGVNGSGCPHRYLRICREHADGSVGVLPRTLRRRVHDSRNLSRGPGTGQGAARLPETGREMAAKTRASRCHQPGDRGKGEQDQPLTATMTATAAANGCHQRPATAHNSRTIRANWGYVRPLADSRSTAPPHREPGLRTSGACPEMSWPTRQPTRPGTRLPSTCIKGSDVGLCTAGLCVMT
jgi:hypothetical protein